MSVTPPSYEGDPHQPNFPNGRDLFPVPSSLSAREDFSPTMEALYAICSSIGGRTVNLIGDFEQFVEPLGQYTVAVPEDTLSLAVVFDEDEGVRPLTPEEDTDLMLNELSKPCLSAAYSELTHDFHATYSHPEKGAVLLKYRDLIDAYHPGNGWTVTSAKLNSDGTRSLKIASGDISSDDLDTAESVLDIFEL